jgi:hypothetical protein
MQSDTSDTVFVVNGGLWGASEARDPKLRKCLKPAWTADMIAMSSSHHDLQEMALSESLTLRQLEILENSHWLALATGNP